MQKRLRGEESAVVRKAGRRVLGGEVCWVEEKCGVW